MAMTSYLLWHCKTTTNLILEKQSYLINFVYFSKVTIEFTLLYSSITVACQLIQICRNLMSQKMVLLNILEITAGSHSVWNASLFTVNQVSNQLTCIHSLLDAIAKSLSGV